MESYFGIMLNMKSFRITLVLFSVAMGATLASAQNKEPTQVITLSQAVDQALKRGDAFAEVQANLSAALAVNKLAIAKNSLTVNATASYGASQSTNSPGQSSSTAPNPYQTSVTTWPAGTATTVTSPLVSPVIQTSAVGSLTNDGILLQNPTATITAGTPLTSVSLGLGTGLQTYPDGTSRNVSQASVKLGQTLWNGYWGGPVQASADKASLAYQVAQLSSAATQNAAVLTVKQAYFTMLSAQENLTLFQATLESLRKTAQITQAKFDQQVATAVDVLTSQVLVRSAELDLAGGQNTLSIARQRLANLMGIEPSTVFLAAPEPDPTLPASTLDQAVALGLKNRIEPQIADLNARSSLVDQNLASGSTTPSVAVTGGVTDYLDQTASKSTLVGQLGVTLGAPLWDAGAAGSSYSQAERTRAAYLTQLHQYRQSIPVDIQEGWNLWQLDLKRLDVAVDNKKAFDDQLEIVRVQFQTGAKALSDLLTAQTNASNADFGLLKAKINAQLAALQLQNLLGL